MDFHGYPFQNLSSFKTRFPPKNSVYPTIDLAALHVVLAETERQTLELPKPNPTQVGPNSTELGRPHGPDITLTREVKKGNSNQCDNQTVFFRNHHAPGKRPKWPRLGNMFPPQTSGFQVPPVQTYPNGPME